MTQGLWAKNVYDTFSPQPFKKFGNWRYSFKGVGARALRKTASETPGAMENAREERRKGEVPHGRRLAERMMVNGGKPGKFVVSELVRTVIAEVSSATDSMRRPAFLSPVAHGHRPIAHAGSRERGPAGLEAVREPAKRGGHMVDRDALPGDANASPLAPPAPAPAPAASTPQPRCPLL